MSRQDMTGLEAFLSLERDRGNIVDYAENSAQAAGSVEAILRLVDFVNIRGGFKLPFYFRDPRLRPFLILFHASHRRLFFQKVLVAYKQAHRLK